MKLICIFHYLRLTNSRASWTMSSTFGAPYRYRLCAGVFSPIGTFDAGTIGRSISTFSHSRAPTVLTVHVSNMFPEQLHNRRNDNRPPPFPRLSVWSLHERW